MYSRSHNYNMNHIRKVCEPFLSRHWMKITWEDILERDKHLIFFTMYFIFLFYVAYSLFFFSVLWLITKICLRNENKISCLNTSIERWFDDGITKLIMVHWQHFLRGGTKIPTTFSFRWGDDIICVSMCLQVWRLNNLVDFDVDNALKWSINQKCWSSPCEDNDDNTIKWTRHPMQ